MAALSTTMSMRCSCASSCAAKARMLAMLDRSHLMTTTSPVRSGMRCLPCGTGTCWTQDLDGDPCKQHATCMFAGFRRRQHFSECCAGHSLHVQAAVFLHSDLRRKAVSSPVSVFLTAMMTLPNVQSIIQPRPRAQCFANLCTASRMSFL